MKLPTRLKNRLHGSARFRRLAGWWFRNQEKRARVLRQGEYINIGCGPHIRPDFYGIDQRWRPGLDLCWDITRALPFKADTVGGIFTEHCIEHISLLEFLSLARDCHRVLMPGRHIRIIVPDAELYARAYVANLPMPLEEKDRQAEIYTPIMSINRIFYSHGHRFIYDFQAMREVLLRAGFRDIQKSTVGVSRDPRLLADTPRRAVESLYAEATK